MRQGPSNRTRVIAYVPPQTIVPATGDCTRLWCKVVFKEKEGWIYRPFLIETALQAAEAGDRLQSAPVGAPAVSVQEFPGGNMPVIGFIPAGVTGIIDLKRCLQTWCRVRYKELEGWVSASELRRENGLPFEPAAADPDAAPGDRSDETSPAPQTVSEDGPERTAALPAAKQEDASVQVRPGRPGTYTVAGIPAGGALALRAEPSPTSPIAGSVPYDAHTIEGMKQCVKQWCLVRYKGVTGYILRRHLVDADSASRPQYRVGGLDFDSVVQVYAFPGGDAEVVGSIPPFATGLAQIGSCDRVWCHVQYFGLVGWVNSRFLVAETPGRTAN